MSKPTQELQTIDPTALAQVSGGTTVTTASASSDQILTALNGILNSIQGLAQPSSGGFNQQEMMMLMMMLAPGTCMVLSARVNGDSPERTEVHGTTDTIKKTDTT